MKKENSNKNLKIYIIIGLLILLIGVGITMAYFSYIRTSSAKTINNGTLSLVYENESTLNLTNTIPLYEDEVASQASSISFRVRNNGNLTAYATISLTDISMSSSLKSENFVYKLYNNDTSELVASGNFANAGTDLTIASSIGITASAYKNYKLYIYIQENDADQSSMNAATFTAKITIKGLQYPGFVYTGDVQTYVAEKDGQYKLEVWGAQGGDYKNYSNSYNAGKGGYSYGTITLSKGTKLYIYVGGAGKYASSSVALGGFNGGGQARANRYTNSGGGASDIRIKNDSLYARVIVAGGGGGTRDSGSQNNLATYSSVGGGESGNGGTYYSSSIFGTGRAGGGGTQITPGRTGDKQNSETLYDASFGAGGYTASNSTYGVGGGGGWYGGGAGSADADGGGGSGWIYTASTYTYWANNSTEGQSGNWLLNSNYYLTNAATIAGNTSFTSPSGGTETGHSGNGFARITYISG